MCGRSDDPSQHDVPRRGMTPTLTIAARTVVQLWESGADPADMGTAISDLRNALRRASDLSALRSRRVRGAGYAAMHAPVTPTPARGNRT
jgi:hypothetical protein